MAAITLIILFFLGLALAYILWKLLFAPERLRSLPLPEEQEEEKPWYYPFPSPPWIKARIQQQKVKHKDKAKHQKMETFLASWGLAPTKVLLPEDFRKLLLVVQEHRKRRLLSPRQQSTLQRLEQLLSGKKEGPVYLPFSRRETKDVFTLLRQLSRER